MIVNRMISSKSVIAKVIADLDLKEDQIRITDIREWILEAILKIGAIQQYDHKVVILPIINHQAALPCDLYKLGQVAFSFQNDGGWLPMRKTTSSFGIFHDRGCGKPCPRYLKPSYTQSTIISIPPKHIHSQKCKHILSLISFSLFDFSKHSICCMTILSKSPSA